jgi:hypothetical protein
LITWPQTVTGPEDPLGHSGEQHESLKQTSPPLQQLRVVPHPSSKVQAVVDAHVSGWQPTHVSPWQVSPDGHGLQDSSIPQPRETKPHPVAPACAHVIGVQHELPSQTSPPPQGAHTCWMPQPRSTGPQPVAPAALQVMGVQQFPA